MVFVDAQRYLKVQDQDLDEAFDRGSGSDYDKHRNSRGSGEDKYSKASFEEFQLEPTCSPKDTPAWRRYMVPVLVYAIIAVIVVAGLILLIIFGMQGDEGPGLEGDGLEAGFEDVNDGVEKVMDVGGYFIGDAIEKVKRAAIAIIRR